MVVVMMMTSTSMIVSPKVYEDTVDLEHIDAGLSRGWMRTMLKVMKRQTDGGCIGNSDAAADAADGDVILLMVTPRSRVKIQSMRQLLGAA